MDPEKPPKRNNTKFNILMICAVSLCTFLFNGNNVIDSIVPLLFCIIVFLSVRIVLCLREVILYRHVYSYDYIEILVCYTQMQHWGTFLSVCLINIIFTWTITNEFSFEPKKPEVNFTLLVLCGVHMILGVVLEWYECPVSQPYIGEEGFSCNIGSRMASGFYYGYLKIITPKLTELIQNYQSRNNIENEKIPVLKLFILIPSDAKVPNKLIATTPGEQDIEVCEHSLEYQVKDRAMVKDRVYKNTIYKIRNQYYVCLEGATPLKTFYQTYEKCPHIKGFIKEVVGSFFHTLQWYLEQGDRAQYVELVYYNNDGENPNIIIEAVLKRLKYIEHLKQGQKKDK